MYKMIEIEISSAAVGNDFGLFFLLAALFLWSQVFRQWVARRLTKVSTPRNKQPLNILQLNE